MSVPVQQTAMSREEIRERVSGLGEWFQNMNLQGVQTAPDHFLGDYPTFKWRSFEHALPANLSGCTVLEIGCNAGFYAQELKRRGADYVLGVDYDPKYLAQARFAAEVNGLDIEFRQLDVYNVAKLGRKFDIVLFMGVLYHLRHPLLALDLLYEHAVKDTLVFQSLQRGGKEVARLEDDYPFMETGIFHAPGYPVLYFVEQCYSHDPTNWWIPNRACCEAMLRSSGFEIAANPEEEIYICKRRPANG